MKQMVTSKDLEEWSDMRNKALKSLDKKKIEAYMDRFGIKKPHDEETFWKWVHLSRVKNEELSKGTRDYSRKWLERRGIEGD